MAEHIDTNCSIYNATDDPIRLICTKDWSGHVDSSAPCPTEIKKYQKGTFLHTNRAVFDEGSKGAVVYRIKNANGEESDWMSAWDHPPKKENSKSHAYTEIREVGHFTKQAWLVINEKLKAAGHESNSTQQSCTAEVTITEGSPADFRAVIKFEN